MIKAITGNLSMLRNAIVTHAAKKYHTIEIGDQTINNANVTNGLDSYLSLALQDDGETTLYIWDGSIFRIIVGVKLSNGRTYYSPISPWPQALAGIVFSITGIGAIVGIPMAIHAFMRNGKVKDQFANSGAVEV